LGQGLEIHFSQQETTCSIRAILLTGSGSELHAPGCSDTILARNCVTPGCRVTIPAQNCIAPGCSDTIPAQNCVTRGRRDTIPVRKCIAPGSRDQYTYTHTCIHCRYGENDRAWRREPCKLFMRTPATTWEWPLPSYFGARRARAEVGVTTPT
jgi:hypothetical protein